MPGMRRREFVSLFGGAAAAWPVVARAQHVPKTWRIGIVTIQPRISPPYAAFDQRLRELGYVDGENLNVDFLNPDAHPGGIDAHQGTDPPENRCHHCALRERAEVRSCGHRYSTDCDDRHRL